jgi:hypothetical protein
VFCCVQLQPLMYGLLSIYGVLSRPCACCYSEEMWLDYFDMVRSKH